MHGNSKDKKNVIKYMKELIKSKSYEYLYFDTLSSTNDYGKENYLKYEKPCVICTAHQTSGRGRSGHTWLSDEGTLTMSIVITKAFMQFSEDIIHKLPLIVGVAVNEVLNRTIKTSDKVMIKWPNDQVYQDQKIGGILVEALTEKVVEAVVIGIGINVNTPVKATLLSDGNLITSLKAINHETYNLLIFSRMIADALMDKLANYDESKLNAYLNEFNYLKGETISFYKDHTKYEGVVLKISENGSLVVDLGEIMEINSGEVSLVRKIKNGNEG